jgi:hypothetical protein
MFYVIRTLQTSRTRILIKSKGVAAIETREEAEAVAARVPGHCAVHEFASDAEAAMYLDPACVAFRIEHDSKPTVAQEAIATADSYLSNAVLPTYTELNDVLSNLLAHLANCGVNTGSELDHGTVKNARALLGRHDRTMAGDFRG